MGGSNQKGGSGLVNRNRASAQNWLVDLKTGTCVEKRSLSQGRFSFGICSASDPVTKVASIYIVGGLVSTIQEDLGQAFPDPILDCNKYDTVNNRWQRLPFLPHG